MLFRSQEFNEAPVRAVTCTLTRQMSGRRRIRGHFSGKSGVLLDLIPPRQDEPVDLVDLGAVAPARVGEHVHNSAYLAWLRAHRASVSFPGAGFDTARFWEILASGALLISKRIQLQFPQPLREGIHYLGFDSLDELDQSVEFALSDSVEVDTIRRAGYDFALAAYSSDAAAERLVRQELRLDSR